MATIRHARHVMIVLAWCLDSNKELERIQFSVGQIRSIFSLKMKMTL